MTEQRARPQRFIWVANNKALFADEQINETKTRHITSQCKTAMPSNYQPQKGHLSPHVLLFAGDCIKPFSDIQASHPLGTDEVEMKSSQHLQLVERKSIRWWHLEVFLCIYEQRIILLPPWEDLQQRSANLGRRRHVHQGLSCVWSVHSVPKWNNKIRAPKTFRTKQDSLFSYVVTFGLQILILVVSMFCPNADTGLFGVFWGGWKGEYWLRQCFSETRTFGGRLGQKTMRHNAKK